ncbi:hypothetical protein MKX01_041352 [Papaver californicum]|nr:hypothetical protein MKX01_041352 [Papaver californicum]
MPRSSFSSSLSTPKVDFAIDMGHPLLNHTVDGFLKIGTVAASSVAVEETNVSKKKNAMLGGAATGALVSAASSNNREKIVIDAIVGGAIATAAEFINYLT